jgi:hypothetical protein
VLLPEVLQQVLQTLTCKQNCGTESGYFKGICAVRNVRRRKLVLAAWLADCQEYNNLYHLDPPVCFWYKCPKTELGDYIPPDMQRPQRNHNLYRMLSNGNTKAANAELSSHNIHQEFNMFGHIPSIVRDFLKPNLLH